MVDDNGSLRHILDFSDSSVNESDQSASSQKTHKFSGTVTHDRVVIAHAADDEGLLTVQGYEGGDVVYQNAFRTRDLVFDPVSVIGRGQAAKLLGVSDTDSIDDNTPESVQTALNSIGFTIVPEGEWWLDG